MGRSSEMCQFTGSRPVVEVSALIAKDVSGPAKDGVVFGLEKRCNWLIHDEQLEPKRARTGPA